MAGELLHRQSSGLTRKSTGLTDAHIELIKLLAAKAVEQYERESAMTDEDDREAVAR